MSGALKLGGPRCGPESHGTIELNTEETPAAFERHARELLDTSGEKFVRRWNAREYDEIADVGEHSENMLLAMFGYGDK